MGFKTIVRAMILSAGILSPLAPLYAQEATPESEQLEFAQSLLSRGMYDMAIAEYQKFITTYPQSASLEEANLAIAESYFLSDHLPEAQEHFEAFKKAYPNSDKQPIAVMRLAQIYLKQNKANEAAAELTAIDPKAHLQGEDLQAFYFYTAKALRAKGDNPGALNAAQLAASVENATTFTPYALEQAAELDAQLGKFDDAVTAYAKGSQVSTDEAQKAHFMYKIGEVLFLAGDYAKAIPHFEEVLKQFPKSAVVKEAVTNLMLAFFNQGQFDDVLKTYKDNKDSIKDDVTFFDTHVAAARAMIELKKYDDAQSLLNKVSSFANLTEANQHKLATKKAAILVKQNKFEDALKILEPISNPNDEDTFLKAQSYFGVGKFEPSAQAFQDVESKFPNSQYINAAMLGLGHAYQQAGKSKEAGDIFLKYYHSNQSDAFRGEALYSAIALSLQSNANDQAINLGQEYLKNFPQGAYFEDVVLLLAEAYVKNKQPQQASDLIKGQMANIKNTNAAHFLLGYALQSSDQMDAALSEYAQVPLVKENPKYYISAQKNSAIIDLKNKKDADAAVIFEKLISDFDQNTLEVKTYLWLANEYLKEKKFKDALRIAKKAQEKFPNASNQEVNYFQAEANRANGDCDQSLGLYDKVLDSKERNTYTGGAHLGKGLCFVQNKKYDDANAEFQKALAENADDPTITLRARYEIANMANDQKNYTDALKFYLLVGTLYNDPNYSVEALMRAAAILELQNHKPEAAKIYTEILEKYKDSPQAQKAQERMAALK